jgi:hypothetical protein
LRDGKAIVSALYNDRALFPDTAKPRAFETCYNDRGINIETLFGGIRLSRNYYHHSKSGTGRFPLDDALGLEGGSAPPSPGSSAGPPALALLSSRGLTTSPPSPV